MTPTISQGYRPGQGEQESVRFNREVRAALNQSVSRVLALSTAATGVLTELYLSEAIALNQAAVLEACVHGVDTTGAVYTYASLAAMFRRGASGAATQVGTTRTLYVEESNAALDITLGVDADSKVFVQVNDGALATLSWKGWVEVMLSP